jgi:hypothetical protein
VVGVVSVGEVEDVTGGDDAMVIVVVVVDSGPVCVGVALSISFTSVDS